MAPRVVGREVMRNDLVRGCHAGFYNSVGLSLHFQTVHVDVYRFVFGQHLDGAGKASCAESRLPGQVSMLCGQESQVP